MNGKLNVTGKKASDTCWLADLMESRAGVDDIEK
jgi:hypothetical protein